jgi:hypothetical protein
MYKKIILIILILIILLLSWIIYKKPESLPFISSESSENVTLEEAINGDRVKPEVANKRPIAVMVENYPDARPQSGLADADLVYEALAEGGITRFEAVFQTKEAHNIGPVRSAREYYADIANELGAIYIHVGGSDMVLEKLAAKSYKNLTDFNQFYNGEYFERISSRSAPHNVYTSIKKINSWIDTKNIVNKATYSPWRFNDSASPSGDIVPQNISIDFSTKEYLVNYIYDKTSGLYLRKTGGKTHTDAESGKQLTAKNIIVQFVGVSSIPNDPKLRIDVKLTGSGKAIIFANNQAIEGTWKKQGTQRTLFYDRDGKEISFGRGQTWIELVPNANTASRVKYD